jgi:ketosteroid isomerase-like protein
VVASFFRALCYDSDYVGVFRVVDGHLASVTEYLDAAYAKQVLFSS